MPIHDWTRVTSGLFHHFHQRWISSLSDALNTGGLPGGYYALAEQTTGGLVPDVLALQLAPRKANRRPDTENGVVATAPPRTRFVRQLEVEIYATKANRIAIRHPLGEVVAIVEIVTPGNKHSRAALRSFVE